MNKQIRQYVGILVAVITYYLVHEGAHFLSAVCFGVFRQIKFMGIGMQIDVYAEKMTDLQMGIFNLMGAVAAFAAAWLLVALRKKICMVKSSLFRAAAYYVTMVMLFLDPVYLSVLCGFFGGGDMNGISLLLPEVMARILFAVVGILHIMVFVKLILPVYQSSFEKSV